MEQTGSSNLGLQKAIFDRVPTNTVRLDQRPNLVSRILKLSFSTCDIFLINSCSMIIAVSVSRLPSLFGDMFTVYI